MKYYGWFSDIQFNQQKNSIKKLPYIYYKLFDGKVLQITEILPVNQKSNYSDAKCLGEIKNFYGCYTNKQIL